jgi:hypothetical protein
MHSRAAPPPKLWRCLKRLLTEFPAGRPGQRCVNPERGWRQTISPLDAFTSVKMGTFLEFQLYMVW